MSIESVKAVKYAKLLPRVKALVTDLAIYMAAWVLLALIGSAVRSDLLARGLGMALLVAMLLYEPVMVWRFGGTIGHIRQNLRIVADRTGGNPGLGASFGRWVTKGVLGIVSFFSIALTRRHQAIHDSASGTTVQVRDASVIRPDRFVAERVGPIGATDVSVPRRLLVIAAYQILGFLLVSLSSAFLISDACAVQDICTYGEDLSFGILGLLWVGLAAAGVVLGWKGRLPGARRHEDLPETESSLRKRSALRRRIMSGESHAGLRRDLESVADERSVGRLLASIPLRRPTWWERILDLWVLCFWSLYILAATLGTFVDNSLTIGAGVSYVVTALFAYQVLRRNGALYAPASLWLVYHLFMEWQLYLGDDGRTGTDPYGTTLQDVLLWTVAVALAIGAMLIVKHRLFGHVTLLGAHRDLGEERIPGF